MSTGAKQEANQGHEKYITLQKIREHIAHLEQVVASSSAPATYFPLNLNPLYQCIPFFKERQNFRLFHGISQCLNTRNNFNVLKHCKEKKIIVLHILSSFWILFQGAKQFIVIMFHILLLAEPPNEQFTLIIYDRIYG